MLDDFKPAAIPVLSEKWGWFAALGLILMICGMVAFANLMVATVISVYFLGALMIFGGFLHLVHAFQVKGWERALFWALSGVLYTLAGAMTFQNPLLTSAILTLLIGMALIVAGGFRLWLGFTLKNMRGWGWIVFSGAVTALAGVVVAIGWPVNSLWILGMFLSVDLFLQGSTLLAFAIALRR
ncbi:MAG: HdeD family acid-resistance protein [Allorhizobium sp.]